MRVFEHREEETHSVCLTFLPFEAFVGLFLRVLKVGLTERYQSVGAA
jgi:hypothetical protein